MQYLYLIYCQGYYKIGVASDVWSRLASLSTGNPFPLTLIDVYGFENAEIAERAIHQAFAAVHVRGEWFNLQRPHLDQFRQLCPLLGGTLVPLLPAGEVTEAEVAEAEEIGTIASDNYRIEKRINPATGEIRGFAMRQRNGGRKVIKYIGKRENREEFEAMLAQERTLPDERATEES